MKGAGFFLLLLLVMIGFYSLVSTISINSGDCVSSAATASVYLLPMQQNAHVFTITTEKADVRSTPRGELVIQLEKGDRVTANCDYSSEPDWCQIAEGRLKGYYFWQGCTNRARSYQENDEC